MLNFMAKEIVIVSWFLGIKNWFRSAVGIFYRALINFRREKIHFQANTLAYRTLVNLVPMLAFLFSFFALFKQMTEVDLSLELEELFNKVLPHSVLAEKILEQVREFVGSAQAGSYLSFMLLLMTSIFLFSAIDQSLNLTFKVERQRNFAQRLVLFTAILVWGPLLIGLSFYLTAKVQFQPILAKLSASAIGQEMQINGMFSSLMSFVQYAGNYLLSFLLVFLSLFFLYKIFPNISVENSASAFGAFFSAIFWEVSKWGFGFFATQMLESKKALYGIFAVFLVFLVWMYLIWVIVLFGAELAYIYQHYRYEAQSQPLKKKPTNRLWLSFLIMIEMGMRFLKGEEPVSVKELAQHFSVGIPELKSVIKSLEETRLITACSALGNKSLEGQYQPARELDQIYLGQLVSAIDSDWNLDRIEIPSFSSDKLKAEKEFILKLFQNLRSEFDQYLSRRSLKEILEKDLLGSNQEELSKEKTN